MQACLLPTHQKTSCPGAAASSTTALSACVLLAEAGAVAAHIHTRTLLPGIEVNADPSSRCQQKWRVEQLFVVAPWCALFLHHPSLLKNMRALQTTADVEACQAGKQAKGRTCAPRCGGITKLKDSTRSYMLVGSHIHIQAQLQLLAGSAASCRHDACTACGAKPLDDHQPWQAAELPVQNQPEVSCGFFFAFLSRVEGMQEWQFTCTHMIS
jgi:hypothetical protein